MKFPTQYSRSGRFISNPGSRIVDIFSSSYDDDGHIHLEKTGEKNIYDEIQSHADSCEIYSILRRFQSGDVNVLSRVQGVYGDFTEYPKTYAEMLNSLNTAEQQFMSLPLDVRAKFDHSFQHWLASMDKPDFFERMGIKNPVDDAGATAPNQPADMPAAGAVEGAEK